MNIMNKIKLWYRNITNQVQKYPVSYHQIKQLLQSKFKNAYIEIEDLKYYACDYDTAKLIASIMPTKLIKYKTEQFDCDNFSRLFWGLSSLFPRLPIGRCNVNTSKGKHSLNCIVYTINQGKSLSFCFIEPQTGQMKYYNYDPYLIII